jgi:hypothetical protein
MHRWFSRAEKPPAAEKEERPPPHAPPPPLRLGVPLHACRLSVDPIQGTVAIGTDHGEVQLISSSSGAEQRLPPPHGPAPVVELLFEANAGRLLVVHSPNIVRIWSLHEAAGANLHATLHVGAHGSAICAAKFVPRSPFAFIGTDAAGVRAIDVQAGVVSPWSLTAPGGGSVCALELRSSDPNLPLLVGTLGGALAAFKLGVDTEPPLIFAAHPDAAALTCATWLADGSDGLVAGYANGDVLLFALRGGSAGLPTSRQRIASVDESAFRRSVRTLRCVGGGGSGGPVVLHATGGTALESQPDGLTLLRGSGFRSRALLAPPRGSVLEAVASCGPLGSPILNNGEPAHPDTLHVLTSRGELFLYSLRTTGAAPRRHPDAVFVNAADEGRARARLALTACGGGRVLVALSVGVPLASPAIDDARPNSERSQANAALNLARDALAEVDSLQQRPESAPASGKANAPPLPSPAVPRPVSIAPFFDDACPWPEGETGFLSGAVGWLQQVGSNRGVAADGGSGSGSSSVRDGARSVGTGEEGGRSESSGGGGDGGGGGGSGGGGVGKWLGNSLSQGLSWASREVAKHNEATRTAPLESLRRRLFPSLANIGARADATVATATTREDRQRDELLGTMPAGRERAEARVRAMRSARKGAGGNGTAPAGVAISKANSAKSAVHQSLEAMHERGEKLEQLGDKSQQLADNAEDFASLAKQLRRQEEKGIMGMFGW